MRRIAEIIVKFMIRQNAISSEPDYVEFSGRGEVR